MQSVTKSTFGGFQKIVWEHIADTLAGGTNVDLNGYTNPDGVLPEGTLVSKKDATTGKCKVVPDASAAPAEGLLGFTTQTVAIEESTWVSVGIGGAIRKDALIENYKTNVAALEAALPKITFVE